MFQRRNFRKLRKSWNLRGCLREKRLEKNQICSSKKSMTRKVEKVCCAEHQKMKASKSIRLTRGIDASLEKPLSSKARKSFERFFQLWKRKMQAAHIDRVLDLNPEKVKQCMDAGLLQYRKRANEIVAHLMAKDDERTAVYRQYEQGSILLEQVEEYEHQYQVAVQKQEAAFKKVMLAVNDIEKAFSHGNPWLMKFRAISIPEKLERTHLKEWLDHVWIVDFEQVEVILQESEWKRFFPEEWLNNGEEDCNGKKE